MFRSLGPRNAGRPVLFFIAAVMVAALAGPRFAIADKHVFEFDTADVSPPPQTVTLAGEFNGWSNTAMPMQKVGPHLYRLEVDLTPGTHYYKFVCDGDHWMNDPNDDRDLRVSDGNGGQNSGVFIGVDYRKLPPPVSGTINESTLTHDPTDAGDQNAVTEDLLRVAVHAQSGGLSSADLVWRAGGSAWQHTALCDMGGHMGQETWETLLGLKDRRPHSPDGSLGIVTVQYYFAVHSASAAEYLAGKPLTDETAAAEHPYSVAVQPAFQTPDWAKHAVWYQIFPERFRNGDTANDPPGTQRWQSKWYTSLPGEAPGDDNFYAGAGNIWKRRYGGDFQGVIQALPYLRDLGVTAIYFNPIFEAESMHKYDASDYRHVDSYFGFKNDIAEIQGETDDPATWKWTKTDKLFLQFVAEAHRQGFKVVIDGVFNHIGRAHSFFQDVLKNRRNSKYASWFEITDFGDNGGPVHYKSWDSTDGALPVWKKDPEIGLAHGPYEHVMAITKRWLAPDGDPSKGVDGWRLDVPGDVPHPFWLAWHKLVKETKPDAYTSGEIWDYAQPWLSKGDQFDATMDYPFAIAMQYFFADERTAWKPSRFFDECARMINAYPMQVSLVEMNLLDSHDTDRFASMIVNPDHAYNQQARLQDSNPHYNISKPNEVQRARQRQAVAFQMTFLGAPMVYYGDEAGMWSASDPSNRQPMIWKDLEPYDDPEVKFDDALFQQYRRLIAIRNSLPALQAGWFQPLKADDAKGLIAFERQLAGQRVVVVINHNAEAQDVTVPVADIPASAQLVDLLDGSAAQIVAAPEGAPAARATFHIQPGAQSISPTNGVLTLHMPAWGAMILIDKSAGASS
jgi:cyclomaltodextrinase / maltogenic alpha-amylase / neopullulanase